MCDEHVHHDHGPKAIDWGKGAIVAGLLALVAYFFSVVLHVLPLPVARILFFLFGPFLALATYALGSFLAAGRDSVVLRMSIVLHVVAAAFVGAMAIVQNLHFTVMAGRLDAAETGLEREIVDEVLWGVNNVQAALDVAWDVWITLAIVLLAAALLRHPLFHPAYAWVGAAVATATLALNLATYPTAPAEAGLVDLGPLVGLWYAAVLVQVVRAVVRMSRGYAGWPEPALV